MKKMFISQKTSMFIYSASVFALFIYSLYFMTNYYGLGLYEDPSNQIIVDFYYSLQGFNFLVFFVSVFGAISVLGLFIFQIQKKVADKLALIVSSVGVGIVTIGSIVSAAFLPGLVSRYLDPKLLENEHYDWLPAGTEHIVKPLTLYVGYILLALVIVSAISLLTFVILTHVKFKKNLADNTNNTVKEVGV